MDDLISGLLGGAFGAYTHGPSGAAAQNANADYWRRQQEEMMQAQPSPEQQREAMRLMMNAQPAIVWRDPPPYEPPAPFWRKRLIRDALSHAEDGLFWWLLVGMALALILRWFLLGGPR